MLKSTNQRVGALAGILLFLGAWLTAFYGGWVLPVLTLVLVAIAFWVALEDDEDGDTSTRVQHGFVSGLIAAAAARVLGLATMAWAFDNWSSSVTEKYSYFSDFFRVLLNGTFWTSLLVIVGFGVVGAFFAYSLPYFTAEKEEE